MRFRLSRNSRKGNQSAVASASRETSRFLVEQLEQRQLLSGTVSGLITDASGTPLADAKVHLVAASTTTSGTPDFGLFATTDASGDYVINDVTDGSYIVKARDKGYVPNASASFTVADGSDTAPTVALTAIVYGTVSGQVTDSTGTPLADALVRLTPASSTSPTPAAAMVTNFVESGRFGLVATTDSNGDYVINNVVAGSYTVTAHDKGYTPNTSASFTVAAGANTAPTVALTAIVYGTVSGQVTDASGNPLSDAQVTLSLASSATPDIAGFGGGRRFHATTDSSGDYVIDDVPAGSYIVTARDHGYVKNSSASFTVAAGSDTAPTVKLTAIVFGTVTGEITDNTGTPLANAWVYLSPASSSSSSATPDSRGGGGGGFGLFAQTDSSGDYTLNNVVAGSYVVNASNQGYTSNSSASFTVAAGSNTAPTVALTPIVYGTVTGEVTDSTGTPLSDARVFLLPQNLVNPGGPIILAASIASDLMFLPISSFFATTDANGDFTINNVPAGSYEVTASDRGYESNTSAAFTVGAGTTTAPTVALTAGTNPGGPPFPIFGGPGPVLD